MQVGDHQRRKEEQTDLSLQVVIHVVLQHIDGLFAVLLHHS